MTACAWCGCPQPDSTSTAASTAASSPQEPFPAPAGPPDPEAVLEALEPPTGSPAWALAQQLCLVRTDPRWCEAHRQNYAACLRQRQDSLGGGHPQ